MGAAVLHTGPASTAWAPWASHSTAETTESQKTPQAGFTFQEGCKLRAWLRAKGQNRIKNYWENKSGCNKSFLREGEGSSLQITLEPDRAMVPRLETSSSWVIPIPVS